MLIHIWFILIYLGRYHEQKPSLNKHEIFSLNAAELSTLMHVWDTGKFQFRSRFHIIKLIKQRFSLVREIVTSHYNVHLKTE